PGTSDVRHHPQLGIGAADAPYDFFLGTACPPAKRLQPAQSGATIAARRPIMRYVFAIMVAICATLSPACAAKQYSYVRMANAEALWSAGGDQSNYINFWKGTPVEDQLNALIARGVPIGGTSAGMNVLTEFVYSALASQGVTSSQALADPFTRYITLDRDFVNISVLYGILDDPHFVTRDRMGRDLAFMCRVFLNGWSSTPRDIAIDEQTALLIDASGHD